MLRCGEDGGDADGGTQLRFGSRFFLQGLTVVMGERTPAAVLPWFVLALMDSRKRRSVKMKVLLFYFLQEWRGPWCCANLVKMQKRCCSFSGEKMEVETCSCFADRCGMARERTLLLVRS